MGDSQRHSLIDRRRALRNMAAVGAATHLGIPSGMTDEVSAAPVASARATVSSTSRVLMLAPDGFDYTLVHRFLDVMPNVRRIMAEGYAGKLLPFTSTWSNINYMSAVTGSAPGTHFRRHAQPDMRGDGTLDTRGPGRGAETIWEALAESGRKSVLIGFPQSVPSGTDLAGVVLTPSQSREMRSSIFAGAVHQTPDVTLGVVDRDAVERAGWPPGGGPAAGRHIRALPVPALVGGRLETTISLADGATWRAVLVQDHEGPGRALALYRPGDTTPIRTVRQGHWTEWIEGIADEERFRVRFHLLDISQDGTSIQLLSSAGAPVDRYATPADLADILQQHLPPYGWRSALPLSADEPYYETGLGERLDTAMCVLDAASVAIDQWGADFFLHKFPIADDANHQCASMADPYFHRYDPERAPAYETVLRAAYAATDTVIGRMLEMAATLGNTHVIVAGDHGICVNNVICDINRRLQDAGLQQLRADGSVDWSSTQAYTKRNRQGNEVYVNLQGRDNAGIVPQGSYEDVQERIIDALLDWRDPAGKKRAVCFALTKRDAPIVGYWGAEAGDIVFAYNQGFTWGVNPEGATTAASKAVTANHGAGIPTQETGVSSNMGILLGWGPKIRAGVQRDADRRGPIPMHHIGATLAELLGCRPPHHSDGAIIREMFV